MRKSKIILFFICSTHTFSFSAQIAAHRGFSGKFPENSLLAFSKAMPFADLIELDIWLSKDNELFVFHDEDLARLTGQTGLIHQSNSQKIKNLKIPTLKETILHVNNQIPINIEIKTQANESCQQTIDRLVSLVKKLEILPRLEFSSFNHKCLELLAKKYPQSNRYALLGKENKTRTNSPDLISYLKKLNVKGANFDISLLNQRLVKELQKNDFRVGAYTVNTASEIKNALKLGVNIYFTNFPDLARSLQS